MDALLKRQKEISLFLGAGASAPFDYAPTKPFIKKLKSEPNLNSSDKRFLDELLSIYHVEDIEHVIEILDSIIELDTKLNRYPMKQMLGKFPLSIEFGEKEPPRKRGWRQVVSLSRRLKDIIERRLFDEYESNPDVHDSIVQVYDPLFDLIESHSKPKNAFEVFTTNFDTVIEDFLFKTRRYDLVDGFRNSEWHPEEFDKKVHLKRLLRFYKLHGSVDWKLRYDKKIMKVLYQRRIKDSRYWKKNFVIYPASKEVPSEDPFETLYRLFRKRVRSRSEVCIAIGFSFRDNHIDKIIGDWLTEVKKSRLIIVSPAVRTSINSLLKREKRLRRLEKEGRVIPVKAKFGEKKTIEMINSHLLKI